MKGSYRPSCLRPSSLRTSLRRGLRKAKTGQPSHFVSTSPMPGSCKSSSRPQESNVATLTPIQPEVSEKHIADLFALRQLQVVCSVGTLTTGIDWDVRCIILAQAHQI